MQRGLKRAPACKTTCRKTRQQQRQLRKARWRALVDAGLMVRVRFSPHGPWQYVFTRQGREYLDALGQLADAETGEGST